MSLKTSAASKCCGRSSAAASNAAADGALESRVEMVGLITAGTAPTAPQPAPSHPLIAHYLLGRFAHLARAGELEGSAIAIASAELRLLTETSSESSAAASSNGCSEAVNEPTASSTPCGKRPR